MIGFYCDALVRSYDGFGACSFRTAAKIPVCMDRRKDDPPSSFGSGQRLRTGNMVIENQWSG
jgi:hypothetical protein